MLRCRIKSVRRRDVGSDLGELFGIGNLVIISKTLLHIKHRLYI
jgi:hypothetical protein